MEDARDQNDDSIASWLTTTTYRSDLLALPWHNHVHNIIVDQYPDQGQEPGQARKGALCSTSANRRRYQIQAMRIDRGPLIMTQSGTQFEYRIRVCEGTNFDVWLEIPFVTVCSLTAAPWKMQKTRMMIPSHHGAQPQHTEVTSWHSHDTLPSHRHQYPTLFYGYRRHFEGLLPLLRGRQEWPASMWKRLLTSMFHRSSGPRISELAANGTAGGTWDSCRYMGELPVYGRAADTWESCWHMRLAPRAKEHQSDNLHSLGEQNSDTEPFQ